MKASFPASSDDNTGLGDDFDDFEEGAEADADDDFGEFDDGFEEPALVEDVQPPAQPVAREAPIPSFVSSHDLTTVSDQITASCYILARPHAYTVSAAR